MKATRRTFAGAAAAAVMLPAAVDRNPEADSLLGVFAKRQTVRRYKSDPVPAAHVEMILDAARRAPTCMNQQPWKFLVVRDPAKIARLRDRTVATVKENIARHMASRSEAEREAQLRKSLDMTEGYFTAPVYVVVLTDNQCPCGPDYARHDGPLAAGYLMLAARALGYGTVYLTDGIPDAVTKEVLAIPDRWHRVCITPIGVPDRWPEAKPKKPLAELVAYETL